MPEVFVEEQPATKSGLFSSAPLVIGVLIVSFCVVGFGAGAAVGGAWYVVNGGKASTSAVKTSKGGKNKTPARHTHDHDEEEEPQAAVAPAPAPEAPKPGSRKLGGGTPAPSAPPMAGQAGALPPPPGGAPAAAAAPKDGEPAAEQPAPPVKRGRYSNSTPDPTK